MDIQEGVNTLISAQKRERIVAVDALRGFAVFGILVSHCYYLFFLGMATTQTSLDQGATIFIQLFVNNKFYTLFSFLFGLSFALMFSRTKEKTSTFVKRYAWRLLLLGLIGLLHSLHWQDDILSIYALLGFFLLPVYNLSTKLLLFISLLLLLNISGYVYTHWKREPSKVEIEQMEKEQRVVGEKFMTAMKSGSYLDTVRANVSVFKYKVQYYLESGRLCYIFAFFLLGVFTGKNELFVNFSASKHIFRKTFYVSAAIAFLLTTLACYLLVSKENQTSFWSNYFSLLMKWQSFALTFVYGSAMALVFQHYTRSPITRHLAAVGKMALTNYVLHALLGTILLCGYGLALLNYSIPIFIAILASVPLFGMMILFSSLWLRFFQVGPLEWLWRTGIYLKWMPIKRSREEKALQV